MQIINDRESLNQQLSDNADAFFSADEPTESGRESSDAAPALDLGEICIGAAIALLTAIILLAPFFFENSDLGAK